ncbi:MAG: NADP-dependent oxidoreductase [Alphaproteobacteria bacterium]|nr:NADP-dependent oxidoreductase [Alphaproteobacteria bacterium]
MTENRQWVLASHPTGMPDLANWRLETAPIPDPEDGEVLIRALYLSVDPYMRGRISPQKNYAAGVSVGEVMQGGGVGVVVKSRAAALQEGDFVESFGFGWRDYSVQPAPGLTKVDPTLGPLTAWLSYLGLPGLTAYFALLETGAVKAGDTVLVSAASGAVGQIVGQIAKLKGARAVAVASSDEKLTWCRSIGYDAGINYRTVPDLTEAVAEACPDGVDVFFDNTAGPIHDAAMKNLALFARIVICGTIALADRFEEPDIGERFIRAILVARAKMQGFLLFDHTDRFDAARAELAAWEKDGRLHHREDIAEGLEQTPAAFLKLLHSENFGKQLVRIAHDPTL